MANIHADVSRWQTTVSNAYPREFLMFRALIEDGSYDSKAQDNLAWAIRARAGGSKVRRAVRRVAAALRLTTAPVRLTNFGVYVIPGFTSTTEIVTQLDQLGVPRDCVVMIDWETWGGKLTGNQSAGNNDLATKLRARQGGRGDLVWGYSNKSDLGNWPTRPDWLGFIIASYGPSSLSQPAGVHVVGWQYTNGTQNGTSYPKSSDPFGACDHNVMFINYPTPSSAPTPEEDMTPEEHAIIVDIQQRLKSTRLTAIDQMAFNINGGDNVAGLRSVVGDMRGDLLSVQQKVGALTPAGFAAALAPLLAKALPSLNIPLAELEQALTNVLGSLDD